MLGCWQDATKLVDWWLQLGMIHGGHSVLRLLLTTDLGITSDDSHCKIVAIHLDSNSMWSRFSVFIQCYVAMWLCVLHCRPGLVLTVDTVVSVTLIPTYGGLLPMAGCCMVCCLLQWPALGVWPTALSAVRTSFHFLLQPFYLLADQRLGDWRTVTDRACHLECPMPLEN